MNGGIPLLQNMLEWRDQGQLYLSYKLQLFGKWIFRDTQVQTSSLFSMLSVKVASIKRSFRTLHIIKKHNKNSIGQTRLNNHVISVIKHKMQTKSALDHLPVILQKQRPGRIF
jgi:hypothetical protein